MFTRLSLYAASLELFKIGFRPDHTNRAAKVEWERYNPPFDLLTGCNIEQDRTASRASIHPLPPVLVYSSRLHQEGAEAPAGP